MLLICALGIATNGTSYVFHALEGKANIGQVVGYIPCPLATEHSRYNVSVIYNISHVEGDVSVFSLNRGYLSTTKDLDVDSAIATTQYKVSVSCRPSNDSTMYSTLVCIIVDPVNEFRPTATFMLADVSPSVWFSGWAANQMVVYIYESTPANTTLCRPVFTDGDGKKTTDGQLTYKLVARDKCGQGVAAVNSATGEIYLPKPATTSVSAPGQCYLGYYFQLTVTDGGGLKSTEDTYQLYIYVLADDPVTTTATPATMVVTTSSSSLNQPSTSQSPGTSSQSLSQRSQTTQPSIATTSLPGPSASPSPG